mmetsp:Transcript_6277/g.9118  ORF Transcript_6277/g.9118 Transcript_6277/m.9118 type:complete len:181 (-) Transcript_6277:195-737(-)
MKFLLLLLSALIGFSNSFNLGSRRFFLQKAKAASIASIPAGLVSVTFPQIAKADDVTPSDDPYADFTTTESGLKYKVTKEGTGAVPEAGQTVKTQYTGWLDGFDSIKKFDSSRDRNRPFSFKVGAGQVIRGWDESFASMQVGERRQIILPPRLGYGDRGAGGIIPGGATLYFDVELLAIQ